MPQFEKCTRCKKAFDPEEGFDRGCIQGIDFSFCNSCSDDAGKRFGSPEWGGEDWFDLLEDNRDGLSEFKRWLSESRSEEAVLIGSSRENERRAAKQAGLMSENQPCRVVKTAGLALFVANVPVQG